MRQPTLTARTALAAIAAAVLSNTTTAQQPLRADRMTVSAPVTVATIDDLKGAPARLAWSSDGSQLYFQTLEGTFNKPWKLRHYVISEADGKTREIDAEPEWADAYWKTKSTQGSPDDPELKIEIKSEAKQERTTSVPMGGDLARGGATESTGTSNEDSVAAAMNAQTVFRHSMLLKGETIGFFENTVIVPGLTFGWGPKGSNVIAYTAKNGRVVVMDATGAKKEIAASKNAVLPAWSPDGSRLAWLQRDGKKKVVLQVARVAAS